MPAGRSLKTIRFCVWSSVAYGTPHQAKSPRYRRRHHLITAQDAGRRPEVPISGWKNAARCHHHSILPILFHSSELGIARQPSTISLHASGEVRAALLDLRQMVTTLAARPTHVKEILPAPAPDYIGYSDTSAFGAGRVWFSGQCPLPETVWRLQWPLDITAAVVSESNPTWALTNSDLEMATVVLQSNDLTPHVSSMHHKSTHIHSDNTPSVAWMTKMATKTANSDAVSITHVAGSDNNLADIASRAILQLDDDLAFLTHFDNLSPLQERFWQGANPPPAQLYNVILTLRGQCLTQQRWTLQSGPPAGPGGSNTTPIVERIDGCATQLPRSAASYSWDLPSGLALDSWEKQASWSTMWWKSLESSRGTSLRAEGIPRPPTGRRQLRLDFGLYPPP